PRCSARARRGTHARARAAAAVQSHRGRQAARPRAPRTAHARGRRCARRPSARGRVSPRHARRTHCRGSRSLSREPARRGRSDQTRRLVAPAYALLASLAWGVGDFMGGLKSRIFPALVVMGASQPFGLAALAIAVAVRGTAPPGPEVAWAALASVFGTLGLIAFYRGMAAGAMSVVVPLAAV